MGLIEEHIKLTDGIISGKMDRECVEKEMKRIESEYGTGSFNSYKVQKKSAPWTKKDLDNLEIQSASGACSKEFYLYMAEVSEYVYGKNKKSGGHNLFKFVAKNWLIIIGVIIFIFVIYWGVTKITR